MDVTPDNKRSGTKSKRGGRKGGPETAKPHRSTPKDRKPHRIFLEYRNRTYMEAYCMKADVSKTCDIFW